MTLLVDGTGFIFAGIFLLMFGFGKFKLSKNPDKQAKFMASNSYLLKCLGLALLVIGGIMLVRPLLFVSP